MVGIVIPTYKEKESLTQLLVRISELIPQCRIYVVDDSPDCETEKAVQASGVDVRYQHRSEKGGRGSAVLLGIESALKEGCREFVEMDADFSHPPEQIPELLRIRAERKSDLLIASRYLPESKILNWPLRRRIFSACSNWIAKKLLRVPVADYTNGFRCYSEPAARWITQHCGKYGKGFISLSEILVSLFYHGFLVTEVPTRFVNRVRGESSLNVTEIKNALVGLFKIYALKNRIQQQRNRHELENSYRNGVE